MQDAFGRHANQSVGGRFRHFVSLVFVFAFAEMRAEAARTAAGFLWWFLGPLLSIAVYYVVFSYFFAGRIENYHVFLSIGVFSWRWFDSTVNSGCWSIRANESLLGQVAVHNVFYPSVTVVTSTAKFLATTVLMIAIVLCSGYSLSTVWLLLPVLILVQLALILGTVYCTAGIVSLFPDLRMVLPSLLHLMFFASGVIFRLQQMGGRVGAVLAWNPMAILIRSYREVLLNGKVPDLGGLGYVLACAAVLIAIGAAVINHFNRTFVKLM